VYINFNVHQYVLSNSLLDCIPFARSWNHFLVVYQIKQEKKLIFALQTHF